MPINPSIAIIIPVRNSEATLPFLLDALQKQTVSPKKIIFVDNRSEDNSVKLIEDFKNRYKGEVLILAEDKKGPSAVRNKGISHADTDFIAFFDSDIIPNDDWIKNASAFFSEHPECDLLHGNVNGYPPEGIIFRFQTFYRHDMQEGYAEKEEDIFWQGFFIFLNALCRRSALRKIGSLNEDYLFGEDIDFHLRALRGGSRVYLNHSGAKAYHYEKYTYPRFIASRCAYRYGLAKIMKRYFSGMFVIRKRNGAAVRKLGFITAWIGDLLWLVFIAPFLVFAFFRPAILLAAPVLFYLMNLIHVFLKSRKKKGFTLKELIIFSFMQTGVVIGLIITQIIIFFRYFVIMI